MGEEYLTFEEVQERLDIHPAILAAAASSGLLGFNDGKRFKHSSVNAFEKYGTQWDATLGRRDASPFLQDPATPLGWRGERQPAGLLVAAEVSSGRPPSEAPEDSMWLVQFYLRPNMFFFPTTNDQALVGPIGIGLEEAQRFRSNGYPVRLFPDPDGRLAMLMAIVNDGTASGAYDTAYDAVAPLLDDLAVRYDQPLIIAHSIRIGVPSGVIGFEKSNPSSGEPIEVRPGPWPVALRPAAALYREAVAANSPFHEFLTHWRCYEESVAVRSAWKRCTE